MSTVIRPEVSKKNPYGISKHRYYELKHFCLQYPEWRSELLGLDGYLSRGTQPPVIRETGRSTEDTAEHRLRLSRKMEIVELTALETDPVLAGALISGVTDGVSYDILNARFGVPCGKDMYYNLYRRFFWLLDKKRG